MIDYKEIPGPVEGYKIFDEDLKCRGFQFKLGMNELGDSAPLVLCEHGFHFCPHPSGVWSYYERGRVFRVRAYDVLEAPQEPGADRKCVCRKIELVEEVFPTGDQNTGDRNTGDRNTGYGNTGYGNTGNRNTGDRNTGHQNTGDLNTGHWNCGNRQTGFFGLGDPPPLAFGKPYDPEQWDTVLAARLGHLLMQDEPFDATPFLALPNATKTYIKKLHRAFIAARKAAKS